MAALVVERLVEQEDLLAAQSDRLQAAANHAVGIAIESPAEEGVEVSRAQLDGQRILSVQGEGEIADGANLAADGATVRDEAIDKRLAFAQRELLLAVGADGVVANAVPGAAGRLTTA